MGKIKIIFVGTDVIGADLLRALSKLFEVILVVTGQDKSAGRKLQLQPSPIKLVAEELGLEVFQPIDINADLSVRRMANLNPDMILVLAYGQILSHEVLDIPKISCLNVHASLLPKYRGASPIQASILNLDKKTGVSLMKMVSKMDAGPVYKQFVLGIDQSDMDKPLLISLLSSRLKKSLNLLWKSSPVCSPRNKMNRELPIVAKYQSPMGKLTGIDPFERLWPKCAPLIHGPARLRFLMAKG